MEKKRRVVITGIGTINPIGNNVAQYFDSLEKGIGGVGQITRFDTSKSKTTIAAEIKNFVPEDHFDRKEARKLDLFTQYALISSEEAINDSGINDSGVDPERVGVIWGAGIGGINSMFGEMEEFFAGDGTPRFSPFMVLKMLPNMAAGHISLKYGYKGPSFSTVSACSSSTHSIVSAVDNIRLGRADAMITGGSEGAICIAGIGGFNAMMALSTRNDDPATASRPYDAARDGFVMGEGGGALVLEEYEHAVARGAKIYAEIAGCGESSDAYHVTAPEPEGEGAAKSMRDALADAGVSPDKVDYINTHGTSTPMGDLAELKGVAKVFGDHIANMNLSSTKSMTGHLLGAAGAIEVLACIMAIQKSIIPPTINLCNPDPAIDPRFRLTPLKAEHREVNYAMSNTFGFGGQNSSVLLKKL